MFIAYSIADKPGLMPGLAAGWIASNSIGKLPDTGFFGTLILAFIAGFLVKFIAEKVKFKDLYNSTVPTFIIPLLSIVFLVLIHVFFIAPIFGSFNQVVIRLAKESGMLGQIIYAIITAAAVAADLGGPVNKTAILIGTPLSAEFIMPMTAINLAIVIPPLGIGLSTMIDRLFKKHGVYDEDMREEGKNAFNLGLIAISEGGLPFLYEKPKGTMIVNVIGSVTGSVIAVAMGAVFWYPIPSIWGWLFVENIPAYITGLAAGVLISAIGNVIIRLRE
jgi:PTS system fructose-specific IIC component